MRPDYTISYPVGARTSRARENGTLFPTTFRTGFHAGIGWRELAAWLWPARRADRRSRLQPLRLPSRVAVLNDATFDQSLASALDRIGGIGSRVKGKKVAVKLNLTGNITRFPNRPDLPCRNNPATVLSLAPQIARAGATRIRLIESFFPAKHDLGLWARYGLDVNAINNVGCKVEWENTQSVGLGDQ